MIEFSPFRYDPEARLLYRGDEEIPLPMRVVAVLESFLKRPGQIVQKDDILASAWEGAFVGEDSLTQAVSQLRSAIGDDPRAPTYIQTIPKRGYRFIAEVSEPLRSTSPVPRPSGDGDDAEAGPAGFPAASSQRPDGIKKPPVFASGETVSHYELIDRIGAGAMGQVWRARDRELQRDVAIKVVPDELAVEAAVIERFRREALMLAAVNHPNIATIHGVEEINGTRFIVMELLDGETLQERLKDGALSVDDALNIALQITRALKVAHDAGIVHRDLKPANIMLGAGNHLKVLDFGLAKDTEAEEGEATVDLTVLTASGLLIGTAAYMSPEQAVGKPIDKRSDIFSFGCVLFEMLAGNRPFGGAAASEVVAEILREEPEWDELPGNVPAAIQRLLRRCLEKDPDRRIHDIADARIEIQEALDAAESGEHLFHGGVATPESRTRSPSLWAVGGVAIGALAVALLMWSMSSPPASPAEPELPEFWPLSLPAGTVRFGGQVAISQDGSKMAFRAFRPGVDGDVSQIYVRAVNEADAVPVPGTEGMGNGRRGLFFSPDGDRLGIGGGELTGGALWIVNLADGSEPKKLCDVPAFRGASWGPDDTIVYAPTAKSGLVQVSANTICDPQPLTQLDPDDPFEAHRFPHHLPGGRALLYTRSSSETGAWGGETVARDLETGREEVLVQGMAAIYVEPGYLLFGQREFLAAARFDPKMPFSIGPATPVLPRGEVSFRGKFSSQALAAASASGDLVYIPAPPVVRRWTFALTSPGSEPEPLDLQPPAGTAAVSLSPQGNYLLLEGIKPVIWIYSLFPLGPGRQLGFDGANNRLPLFTPDEQAIVFASDRDGPMALYIQPADWSEAPELLTNAFNGYPQSFSADGSILVYGDEGSDTAFDLWMLSMDDPSQPRLLVNEPFDEWNAHVHPSGEYFAYNTAGDPAGGRNVYIKTLPEAGDVASWRGRRPRWSRDGDFLSFEVGGETYRVPVTRNDGDLEFGDWELIPARGHGVAADGRTLITLSTTPPQPATELRVIRNFGQLLVDRVARER